MRSRATVMGVPGGATAERTRASPPARSPRPALHGTTTLTVDPCDVLTGAGAAELLRQLPDVTLLTAANGHAADVAIVLVDVVDEDALVRVRRAGALGRRPVVLVAGALDEDTALTAVEAGARAILRRDEVTSNRLAEAVRSAVRGDGSLPSDILGRLLDQVRSRGSAVLTPPSPQAALTEREVEVLRLVAEGLETAEIAERLNYAQRTIKGVLHDVTARLNLRNRAHAVAYAIREGLI